MKSPDMPPVYVKHRTATKYCEKEARRFFAMEEHRTETSQRKLSTKDMAAAAERDEARKDEARSPRAAEGNSDFNSRKVGAGDGDPLSPLLSPEETGEFRSRWSSIQTGFVDEPRKTVEQADELVAEIMQRLAQSFSDQRSNLEKQWERSDEVSTEELRLALRRYRSFFDRLLAI
jgi:hypothetical protein